MLCFLQNLMSETCGSLVLLGAEGQNLRVGVLRRATHTRENETRQAVLQQQALAALLENVNKVSGGCFLFSSEFG